MLFLPGRLITPVAALAGTAGGSVLTAAGPFAPVQTSPGWNGFTLVSQIASSLISNTGHTETRVKLMGAVTGAENAQCNGAYIGMRAGAGDAYDFAATPVQLLVGGSGTFTVPNAGFVTTDWATFTITAATDLLIAFQFNNISHDSIGIRTSVTGATKYEKAGADAATVNKTGYGSTVASTIYFVNLVEVRN